MKIRNIVTLFSLLLFIATSCENDGFYYQDEPRVRLEAPYEWALGSDSLEFSFVTTSIETTEQQFTLSLYVMGAASDQTRTVRLEVLKNKTTAAEGLYDFPMQVTIPAGSLKTDFTLIVKRSEILKEQTARLYIQVVKSDAFDVGVHEQNHLLVKWNDILSRPNNWREIEEEFGEFSLEKYRFILSVNNIREIDFNTITWAQLNNYRIKVYTALEEYNAAHPGNPLKDENGNLIVFPAQ